MKLLALCVLALTVLANGEKVDYTGYFVNRMTPATDEQANALMDLEGFGVKFWTVCSKAHKPCDVMFPPNMTAAAADLPLVMSGLEAVPFIPDVKRLIDESESKTKPGAKLALDDYASLEQIYEYLNDVAAASNGKAKVIQIGKSFENRPLVVLKIATGTSSKPAIWLDANIHAREWITSAIILCLINEVLNGNNATITSWSDDFDLYIMPVVNPDGLAYTKDTDRMWRKTRSTTNSKMGCKGADANRNFGYKWLSAKERYFTAGGSSTNPCSDIYAGSEAFSEVESQAVRDFITSISDTLVSYISVHSYGQYILLPFGHERNHIPQYDAYMSIGNSIAQAMKARNGTDFVTGNIVDLLYVSSGGSMDWVKARFNPNLTMTFEMRDKGRYGFLLPASQIIPSCQEFLDGFCVIVDALRHGIDTPPLPSSTTDTKKPSPSPATITRTRTVPSILDKPVGHHDTFGNVPHPRRGISPLKSFQRF